MIDGSPRSPRIAITDTGTPIRRQRSGNRAPKMIDTHLLSPAHSHGRRRGGTRPKISSPTPYTVEVTSKHYWST